MPYSDGKLIRYNGSSWVPSDSEDFFFKIYLQAPVKPTYTVVSVDYLSGDCKGVLLDDSGRLTTDMKFLMSVIVDDTASISWSDPVSLTYNLQDRLPLFFENVLNRTKTTVIDNFPSGYPVSYVDFWIFNNVEINRSIGFTNSISNVQTYANSLFLRGLKSTLTGSSPLILGGLNQQSVIDAFFDETDSQNNGARVNNLINYLSEIGCLRLEEIYDYWKSLNSSLRSAWADSYVSEFPADSNSQLILKNSIYLYTDVSEFVVSRWAKSFIPVAMIVADGDNISSESASVFVQAANSCWGDLGAPALTFGLGKSQSETLLRTISSGTGGNHFYISEGADWDDVETSLLHGGAYSLYSASCYKTYEYDDFVWVSQIDATFTPAETEFYGRSCKVEFRWSADRLNFTQWEEISSGVPKILKKLILIIEYRITMRDGWDGSTIKPILTSLTHTIVTPSVQYLFTQPQQINGMMFEVLLNAAAFLPSTATAQWGISRGNSVDFADYSPIHISRKSALPNRQSGVSFTEKIVQEKLPTKSSDSFNTVYEVYDKSLVNKIYWTASDIVEVFELIGPNNYVPSFGYTINEKTSTISYNEPRTVSVFVTITTPSSLFVSRGEKTTTKDYKTYYLSNGRWSRDNNVIVLVNDKIVRGGYWTSPEDGTVTFTKEREETDLISVFVEFSDLYRVGIEIKNYDPTVDNNGNAIPLDLRNFGLMFNVLNNNKLQAELANTTTPEIINQRLLPESVNSSGSFIEPTIYQRLTVDYKFYSVDNAAESGTIIKWWRYRSGQDITGQETNEFSGDTYIRLTDYNNRITEKKSDVGTGVIFGAGDKVIVELIPSDGFKYGGQYFTRIITLDSDKLPFIVSLKKPVNISTASNLEPPSNALSWTVSAISTSTSFFEAGTYYVGISFFNSTGETVISNLKSVELNDFQSISISQIDLPEAATGINYYCSIKPNSHITLTGTFTFSSSSTSVSGSSTMFIDELKQGDLIFNSSNVFMGRVSNIVSNTSMTLTANASANFSGVSRLIPVFLGQTNAGGAVTNITEMAETVYISAPNLVKDATTGLASAPITDEITAVYTYRNPDNADNTPDETIVEWYLKDNETIVKFTGKTIPANSTKRGEVYIFKATPFNGIRYGTPVWSSTVLMT